MLAALTLVSMSFIPLGPEQAFADDVSEYITGLTVTPENINTNGKATVEVTFSDGSPGQPVFKGGDTIEITWPTSGTAYIRGFATTIPLVTEDGVTYAYVTVTSSGAVITFTDAVNDMYDVSGHFYFSLIGYNNAEGNEADTQTVTITAGTQTAEINITKPATGAGTPGELPDFRKQASDIGGGWSHVDGIEGWVMTLNPDDPTYTQWTLTANERKNEVTSTITITDDLGPGQTVDWTWARLFSNGTHNKSYSGSLTDVINAFNADFPESSLQFDSEGSITWKLDPTAVNRESWCLEYRCDINDFSLSTFSNNASLSWNGEDGQPYSTGSSSQFANVDQGGGIVGLPRGVLQITKKIGGTDVTVPEVVFTLQMQQGDEWVTVGTLTTDAGGMATMTRLKTGHYRLFEVEAPEYMDMQYTEEDPYEFNIDLQDPQIQSLALTVENTVKVTEVSASKVWLNAEGEPDESAHPTIFFQLYRTNKGTGKTTVVGSPKILGNGVTEVAWGELPQYDVNGNVFEYFVKEVDAEGNDWVPSGYSSSADGLTVVNQKNPIPTIDIKGSKTWNDNNDQDGKRPDSIVIRLLADGEEVARKTVTAEDDWAWEFTDLPQINEEGAEIAYTVAEEPVAGYTAEYDGTNIINTHKVQKTWFQVFKRWDDNDDQDGMRPSEIEVVLLANGEPTDKTLILSEENSWQGKFTNLDVYEDGEVIEYTVQEVTVEGYTSTVTGDQEQGFQITNHHTPKEPDKPDKPSGPPKTGDDLGLLKWFSLYSVSFLALWRFLRGRKEGH